MKIRSSESCVHDLNTAPHSESILINAPPVPFSTHFLEPGGNRAVRDRSSQNSGAMYQRCADTPCAYGAAEAKIQGTDIQADQR
jgi:hypothetical protein